MYKVKLYFSNPALNSSLNFSSIKGATKYARENVDASVKILTGTGFGTLVAWKDTNKKRVTYNK